jgi:dephospho-CoA kinase
LDTPEDLQLERTIARDNNDEAQVRRIMAAQMKRADRLERADIVIDNSGALADLLTQVDELHKEFLLRAEAAR